jgi:hypothetical protein
MPQKKEQEKAILNLLIRSKEHSDFVIVIECKADPKNTKVLNFDKYSEYAVDGVLFYASFLVKRV